MEERDKDKVENTQEQPAEQVDNAKKPSVKLNKKIIIIIISFLLTCIVFAFLRAISKTQTNTVPATIEKNVDRENYDSNKVDYSNVKRDDNMPTNKTVSYDNLVKEDKSIETVNTAVVQNNDSQILGKNIKLEEYYTRLVEDELSSRSSDIGYTAVIQDIKNNVDKTKEEELAKEYNPYKVTKPLYSNEVKAGSVIPAIMLTGINSDLGGNMVGIVRENVYDTVTGKNLLIPKGTKIIGNYDNMIGFGQERLLVVWDRLIFPNGNSLLLSDFKGTDLSGSIGMKGKVDNHTFKLLESVVLSSILGGVTNLVKDDNKDDTTLDEAIAQAAGERILDIGEMLAERVLNVKPTIKIAPATRFNVLVSADLVLDPYEGD